MQIQKCKTILSHGVSWCVHLGVCVKRECFVDHHETGWFYYNSKPHFQVQERDTRCNLILNEVKVLLHHLLHLLCFSDWSCSHPMAFRGSFYLLEEVQPKPTFWTGLPSLRTYLDQLKTSKMLFHG